MPRSVKSCLYAILSIGIQQWYLEQGGPIETQALYLVSRLLLNKCLLIALSTMLSLSQLLITQVIEIVFDTVSKQHLLTSAKSRLLA